MSAPDNAAKSAAPSPATADQPTGDRTTADQLTAAAEPPSAETLKAALKAFRKRLKVTQLDNASRIGKSPLSGSGRSTIDAITPPDQYPRAVWDALVKEGKLRPASHGMFRLASGL